MISHKGDVSDDVIKYPKIEDLTHIFHIWQVFFYYWNGAYSTGCYQHLICQCELLL